MLTQSTTPLRPGDSRLPARFWAKVKRQPSGCWEWTGSRDWYGYGRFLTGSASDGSRKMSMAHRVAFEAYVGLIPPGFEADHLCHNPPCVNPRHIEAVTHRENIQRGFDRRPKPTHCPEGHPYSGSNLYRHPRGTLVCRRCTSEHRKRYWERVGADVKRERHREYMSARRQRAK